MKPRIGAEILYRYFLASYFTVAMAAIPFLLHSWRSGGVPAIYSASLFLTYSAFYLLPAILLSGIAYLLLCGFRTSAIALRFRTAVVCAIAVVTVVLVEFALIVDGIVVREFGFHLNGFVLNLVSTPGGIESMGLGETLPWTCGIAILTLLLAQSTILWTARSRRFAHRWPRLRASLYIAPALLLLSVGEHAVYILGDVRSDSEILAQASAFPFYQPRTARKLARRWGLEVSRRDEVAKIPENSSPLDYPRRPIDVDVPVEPLNIVWLVGESLRFDALTPEIMPATWALAEESWSFKQHFSGGNGTRMGVFSMFYGLYGPYWFSFLNERRGPVLIDVLSDQNYRMVIHTSARFSYPEFDRTVFARVAEQDLHDSADEYYSKSLDRGWKEDVKHTNEIINFLETRDRERPFFVYMFFESTHYRYYFPDGSAVREPYLQDMTMAALGAAYDPALLHNRYLNAAHHLDTQVERILDVLDATGESRNTIVIVTGDHGEEFMEKGRRGHNSEFHDEQIHVPLVLSIPGDAPRRIYDLTSHIDLAPTLLPLLGVKNVSEEYALGRNLRGSDKSSYVVVADWSRIAIINQNNKLTVPVGGGGILETAQLTSRDDAAIAEPAKPFMALRPTLAKVMSELREFKAGDGSRNDIAMSNDGL